MTRLKKKKNSAELITLLCFLIFKAYNIPIALIKSSGELKIAQLPIGSFNVEK